VSAYLATIIKCKHELRARRLYQIIFTRNVSDDFNVSRKTDNQFVTPLKTNDPCFDAKALAAPEIPLRSDQERMRQPFKQRAEFRLPHCRVAVRQAALVGGPFRF
jgi:hypothetical protein